MARAKALKSGAAKSKGKPVAKKVPSPAKKKTPVTTKAVKSKVSKPVAKPKKPAKPIKASKPVAKKKAAPKPAVKKIVKAVAKTQPAPARKLQSVTKKLPTPVAKVVASTPKPATVAPAAPIKTEVNRTSSAAITKPPRSKAPVGSRSNRALTEDEIRHAGESEYMSDDQLAFFRERLLQMRNEVLARELDVKERLHQREVFADPADRASAEEEHWLDLRLRERESLLLRKIDEALRRIRDREYGFCEKTGEPIGIARLLARPTATVCVDVKGQDERAESQYRDR